MEVKVAETKQPKASTKANPQTKAAVYSLVEVQPTLETTKTHKPNPTPAITQLQKLEVKVEVKVAETKPPKASTRPNPQTKKAV